MLPVDGANPLLHDIQTLGEMIFAQELVHEAPFP